jgi:hypothetical protein
VASELFRAKEMCVMEETKGITLSNFLPWSALLGLLRKKLESMSARPL